MKICIQERPDKDADEHPMMEDGIRYHKGEIGNPTNNSYIVTRYRCYNCGLIVKSITTGAISK